MDDGKWSEIIVIYQQAKRLLILGEENNLQEMKVFIAPFNEFRSALDHICRAKAAELGIHKEVNSNYITKNFGKAADHLYRAFFDVADWMGIVLREKVVETLSPYTRECINTVLPEYFAEIKPRLERLNSEIAEFRNNKDVGDISRADKAEEYSKVIRELLEAYQKVVTKVPDLIAFKEKQEKKP